MILLLDAANTLIYKPSFYIKFIEVLRKNDIIVNHKDFHKIHKVVSEFYSFPDRTSKNFYMEFNGEVLYGLGIIPNIELLEELFLACSYLEWSKFEDTIYLNEIKCQKAVLSNFHNGLDQVLNQVLNIDFISISNSENEKCRKPELKFFENAITKLGVHPSEIIYIGDSIKLDLEPGLKVGMNAWLIDRDDYYPYCKRRVRSLEEIVKLF